MQKISSFEDWTINEAEKPIPKKEPIDPIITNITKKFDYDDLFIYFKGLMVKYLDINFVKKMIPNLDNIDEFSDYTLIFTKLEPLLNKIEKTRFAIMKKIFKKKFDKDQEEKENNKDVEQV